VGPAALADRLAGSSDLFCHDGRSPLASINFVTAHDGFTLADLVTYETKRNEGNGEDNRDGTDASFAWNAGVEGPSDDPAVTARRRALRQVLLAALLAARGVPMLTMGDEHGHTQRGNNNAWCRDDEGSWLDWDAADAGLAELVARLVAIRQEQPALRGTEWLVDHVVDWLDGTGETMTGASWRDPANRVLGLHYLSAEPPLLLLFNGGLEPVCFALPPGRWQVLLDTAGEGAGPAGPLAAHSARFLAASAAP
jgi:glycogen operon protein